jgi:hypothetical protein
MTRSLSQRRRPDNQQQQTEEKTLCHRKGEPEGALSVVSPHRA